MGPHEITFLNLRDKPASFSSEQARIYLGFQGSNDITTLVSCGLLKPLASSSEPDNSTKYFAKIELDRLGADVKWMSRARAAIRDFWRHKNARQKARRMTDGSQNGHATA